MSIIIHVMKELTFIIIIKKISLYLQRWDLRFSVCQFHGHTSPKGIEKEPNKEGLAFYRRVFEELKKYNIEPLVTIFHYDMPVYLEEELGGWGNRELIDLFEKYGTCIIQ